MLNWLRLLAAHLKWFGWVILTVAIFCVVGVIKQALADPTFIDATLQEFYGLLEKLLM